MKLIDLNPVWVHPDVFIFKEPTKGEWWLSCKKALMSTKDQHALFDSEAVPEEARGKIVMTVPECAWAIKGTDFNTMTVLPSIDASRAKMWHGFITNGDIVGGL